ncbi:MAG: ROK family protein [Paludisphaera borealis]|uniref:ROK family protein n=1 Tax=Paludisphaera borealis TaxID=1387353 RepID=UPI00283AE248|nr:ROK family protein [Paludisphaera borealis]MDR3621047.1 ROK family protein [Paludisphaera borealis]
MAGLDGGPLVVGVDLGGTKILAGVVSADNRILGRGKRTTPAKDGGPAILQAMTECVDEALTQAGVSRDAIAAGGIGSPGPLDVHTGVILFSANLNVKNYPIGPELAAVLDAPVVVRNDVRVGGYGEFVLGAGRGYRNVISAFVGTGIGGCIIVDGRIVTGSTENAGEIGHIIIKAGGPKCGCGQRGCMEALSSKTAIAGRVAKAVKKKTPTVLGAKMARKGGRLKSGDLAEAVADNDSVAVREVRRAAHFLGLGLGGLVNVLGPEIVIIGGGVAQALGDSWLDLVRTSARRQILTDPEGKIQIVRASLGDDAAVLGAALMARESLLKS